MNYNFFVMILLATTFQANFSMIPVAASFKGGVFTAPQPIDKTFHPCIGITAHTCDHTELSLNRISFSEFPLAELLACRNGMGKVWLHNGEMHRFWHVAGLKESDSPESELRTLDRELAMSICIQRSNDTVVVRPDTKNYPAQAPSNADTDTISYTVTNNPLLAGLVACYFGREVFGINTITTQGFKSPLHRLAMRLEWKNERESLLSNFSSSRVMSERAVFSLSNDGVKQYELD